MKMIDIDDRDAQAERHALGKTRTHQQRAEQARTACKTDGAELFPGHTGSFERRVDHRHDILLMRARRQFRHHTSELSMDLLRGNHIAQQHPVADDSRRRIIARRLYT